MPDRRAFLRLLALGTAGVACTRQRVPEVTAGSPTPADGGLSTPSPSPTDTVPARSPSLRWSRLDVAGPPARREHTFTGAGDRAYLFGGRAEGTALDDLWSFDRGQGSWERIDARGPSPRFGHNAEIVGGHLVVFGGQRGSELFNDAWLFDPDRRAWRELDPAGRTPGIRYGAGSVSTGTHLFVTHGFNFQGRFDDTARLSIDGDERWSDRSPSAGPRPVRRCLHRCALRGQEMLLYGGQADGRPFLGDTWIYDLSARRWREARGRGPGGRNLYALGGVARRTWLVGGFGPDGPLDDVWELDADLNWRRRRPDGRTPPARGGIEGALIGVDGSARLLIFGGSTGARELADLWELELPARA